MAKTSVQHGIKGLKDIPRKGRPAIITLEERVQVMALACTKPDHGRKQWTTTKLADATGLSGTSVFSFLNEATRRPHKIDHWCGKNPDLEFEPKQSVIPGLHFSPPENALMISVDAKSQITQPMLPLRSGLVERQTHIYTRHGTTCLLAALLVHEGVFDGRCVDSHAHVGFHVEGTSIARIWQSKQELVNRTMLYIKHYNNTSAAPFNWTYTAKPRCLHNIDEFKEC